MCDLTDGSKSADCKRLDGGNDGRSIVENVEHTGGVSPAVIANDFC